MCDLESLAQCLSPENLENFHLVTPDKKEARDKDCGGCSWHHPRWNKRVFTDFSEFYTSHMACYWYQWQSNLSFRVKAKWTPLKTCSTFVVKNLPANAGDVRDKGSISGLGRYPGGEHGNPLQYSCLEKPMDRGDWKTTVHGVAKSRTQLTDFHFIHTYVYSIGSCHSSSEF